MSSAWTSDSSYLTSSADSIMPLAMSCTISPHHSPPPQDAVLPVLGELHQAASLTGEQSESGLETGGISANTEFMCEFKQVP